jgi:transcriptional regulator with XRE-family HTH domain
MSLGSRIRTLRKANGMTQQKLADAAGIHQSSLSELERGDTKKGFGQTIVALAKALNTNPEWLTTGKGNPAAHFSSTIDGSEALAIYQGLPDDLRAAWMAAGRAMLAGQSRSASNPFPTSHKAK